MLKIASKKISFNALMPYWFIMPALLFYIAFIAYPILQNFINSFFQYSAISITRDFVGFSNFNKLLHDEVFWLAFRNNIFFSIGSVIGQCGLGLILANIIQRRIKRGEKFFRTAFFLPMVMSVVAVGLLWTFIYDPIFGMLNIFLEKTFGIASFGWLGSPKTAIWSIIVTANWQNTGFSMVIILAGLQSIPESIYEAAVIDGANENKIFWHITIPSIKDVLSVAVLVTIIGSFKVFDYVWVMTKGGPAHASEVITTYLYTAAFKIDKMGYASAIGSMLFIITLLFTLLRLRSLSDENTNRKKTKNQGDM